MFPLSGKTAFRISSGLTPVLGLVETVGKQVVDSRRIKAQFELYLEHEVDLHADVDLSIKEG